tara:strand:- start:1972 stop:2976 length:1005 start_codon:yes stop_codon:yes gene_type:complete
MNLNKKINLDEKIFVAGSRGMAGSAICRMLKDAGYGEKENGGEIIESNRSELNFLNSKSVSNWFHEHKPTVVVIAAAKVGGILANAKYPTEFLLENLKIQTNIIESSFACGTKRLLFLGSSCIYPKFAKQPIKEDSLLTGQLEPTNEYYAIAKIAGIKLCQSLKKQYNFDAISLMPTNLYGTNDNYDDQNSHVMAALLKKFYIAKKYNYPSVTCWGTGSPLREFMHVDDLGRAVVFVLENWDPLDHDAPLDDSGDKLHYLNVGTGIDISIKDLSKKIAKEVNYKGEIIWDHSKPDGTPKKQLNINKIKSLGWEPKISLDEGIKRTIQEISKTIY